jgi:hypothetical protein
MWSKWIKNKGKNKRNWMTMRRMTLFILICIPPTSRKQLEAKAFDSAFKRGGLGDLS